jgi:hypothetical protein
MVIDIRPLLADQIEALIESNIKVKDYPIKNLHVKLDRYKRCVNVD